MKRAIRNARFPPLFAAHVAESADRTRDEERRKLVDAIRIERQAPEAAEPRNTGAFRVGD
jgi:hypothetical protein